MGISVRVLGIDPGTAVTGFGLVEPVAGRPGRLIECGVIRTRAADSLPARLQVIYEGIEELIARLHPTVMAVEGIFHGVNARSTVILGHTRGVILLAGLRGGLEVVEYSPAEIKKAMTDRGAALKGQVGFMVAKLLQLRTPPAPADAADAVAVALTHVLRVRRPKHAVAAQ